MISSSLFIYTTRYSTYLIYVFVSETVLGLTCALLKLVPRLSSIYIVEFDYFFTSLCGLFELPNLDEIFETTSKLFYI